MKVAVISNSHAGSLQNAISKGNMSAGDHEFTFFARPGGSGGIKGLFVENNILSSKDGTLNQWWEKTCGFDSIDLAEYDMFWYHGINIDPIKLYPIYKSNAMYFSKQLKEKYYPDLISQIPAFGLYYTGVLKLLRENTNKPIITSNRAFWSKTAVVNSGYLPSDYGDYESIVSIKNIITQSAKETYEQFDAIVLSQPEMTLMDEIFTREEYCNEDGKHMNVSYGELVMEDFFRAVSNLE